MESTEEEIMYVPGVTVIHRTELCSWVTQFNVIWKSKFATWTLNQFQTRCGIIIRTHMIWEKKGKVYVFHLSFMLIFLKFCSKVLGIHS